MKTPITPEGLAMYDQLGPSLAAVAAWTSPGNNPAWHNYAKAIVRETMPVLARNLDRLAADYQHEIRTEGNG